MTSRSEAVTNTSDAGAKCLRLPLPPPLALTAKDAQKKRLRDIEKALKTQRATLSDGDRENLGRELDEIAAELSRVPDKQESAGSMSDEEVMGTGDRKMTIKKEIREIEKQIKAHKKKPILTNAELIGLGKQLEKLKVELTEQAGGPPVMSLQLCRESCGSTAHVKLSLSDRASLSGLSDDEANALWQCFMSANGAHEQSLGAGVWDFRKHSGLHTAGIRGRDLTTITQEFENLLAAPPHAICVHVSSLMCRGGVCAALRDFAGTLVVIEEFSETDEIDEEIACLLQAVGVKSRWRAGPALQQVALPEPVKGEIVGDLRLRDVRENPMLEPLLVEADRLSEQEFHENLTEIMSADVGVKLALLVPPELVPGRSVSNCTHKTAAQQFLGFITYKFWEPPLRAMSISRVAVPRRFQMLGFGRQIVRWAIERAKQKPHHECNKVMLSAIPKAIRFYERMNFTPVVDDDDGPPEEEVPANEDQELGALRMEYNYGRTQKSSSRR